MSWLGGLGSGLGQSLGQSLGQVGGNLSSFTEQISSFTKDMLLEGTEEVGDAATELKVSNSKLTDLEAAFATQKSEYERLKKIHAELEEKHEAAEIQIKRQSAEYRSLVQQKEVEISHLKARESSLQEEMLKLRRSAGASCEPAVLPVTSASSFLSETPGPHQAFHTDDMDFGDVIWSQQEINRLSAEVSQLKAQVSHWKELAQASKPVGIASVDQSDILKLQKTIKELRESTAREVDEHQHELAALQDAQSHKIADVTRRHREELAEYEERIEELEEQVQKGTRGVTGQDLPRVAELQTQVRALQDEVEQQNRRVQELTDSLSEAGRRQARLQEEKEEARAENGQLLQNYARLQSSVEELQTRVQEQEEKAMHKVHLDNEIQMLRKALAGAEKEITRLQSERNEPEVEHADILELNTIIGTLKKEKTEVEKQRMELLERLRHVEESGNGDVGSPAKVMEELRSQLEEKDRALNAAQVERDTICTELEELDRQNQEATQHVITLKDQLSAQRREADTSASRLQEELGAAREQKEALQRRVEEQQAKLSQSAFALNDMHMRRQQLEGAAKEMQEKLARVGEQSAEARRELTELKERLQEREQELSHLRSELSLAGSTRSESEGQQKEMEEFRRELQEARSSHEAALSRDFELRMENKKLKAEVEEVTTRVEGLSRQLQEGQAALSRTALEKDTRINALKLEKDELESELSQAEKRLAEQSRLYQQTIEELTRARTMDTSALQVEHERAVKLNREKDAEIAELKREVEQMAVDRREAGEMLSTTMAGQAQLRDLLQEKDAFVETLKAKVDEVQQELDRSVRMLREGDALRQTLEEKDRQLGAMKEENSHLKEEIDRLRDQQGRPHALAEPRTLDIITELETEIAQLKAARDGLDEELVSLRKTTEDQRAGLSHAQQSLQAQQYELEQARVRHEQSTLNYEKLIRAKDEEIFRMQEDQHAHSDSPSPQGLTPTMVILQEDKTQSLNGDNGNEKHDLSKVDIEKLVKGIKEKENEINLLNEKNLSLTKQLDQMVVSRDEVGKLSQMVLQKDLEIQALHAKVLAGGHSQDVMFLQQQLQSYAVEREQVLAVLNEKTRENSQLRADYHRLMDIVAGKEAALLRLQQENQRLSTMSDPSGSQEMFRETIQNLSRIIREKDIEIDALTQKCQTLVTVLQVSGGDSGGGGGVSSNQFEELLQERDTLKQQVKKMEEWKQQVITTVKNMQHESAQLQEELVKLQGQISADSDCSSKLSVDYARLIQSYEQKERRLGSLSQELAQVQQTICQLSSTKEALFGKLDSVAQGPEATSVTEVPVTSEVPAAVQQGTLSQPREGQLQCLRLEIERLQGLLVERDATVRTLQENNHRLSNTVALASSSEQRGQVDEVRQVRDRLESLQKTLKEKDLLIKAKGDQLSQVSESLRNRDNDNEVLKQAVTNLRERTLILELDIRTLKEENERVAAHSREKESEFRALQETNMQVSLLLKEKEFELAALREKAAAMETMLKDGEQGKSGELNQLLNEVRSMQEKAVSFQQERDQVILALKQKQMETSALQNELQHMRDKEQRLQLELERLRSHLLEIEDSYTREALAAEDREAELRRRVAQLDERLLTSSCAVESASQQASLQVESLQEQLSGVMRQRDEALAQLHMSQEQVKQYAMSLSNLQMVLEQFQQEEKALYSAELEKHRRENTEWKRKAEVLEEQVAALQVNLDEATAALDSATRLTDQLDHKEEQIEELKKQVEVRQEMLEEAQNKLMNLLNSTEGKVDRVLMQNLFVGYFHTPRNKRAEVLRLMGSVLGLDRANVEQLLEDEGRRGMSGWVSSWLGGRSAQSVPNTPQRPGHSQSANTSFTEMFVKFLEVESRPSLPPLKLPVYDIKPLSAPPSGRSAASAATTGGSGPSKRPGEGTAFLAPRSAAVPLLNPGSTPLGGAEGHLLMKPISDSLPTFTPVPVSAEASAGSVLKDLLKH